MRKKTPGHKSAWWEWLIMADKHIWEKWEELSSRPLIYELYRIRHQGAKETFWLHVCGALGRPWGKGGGFGSFGFPYYTGGRKRGCCWRAGFAGKVLVWRHFGLRNRGSSRSCRYFTAVRVFSCIRSSLGKNRGRLCNKGRVSKTAALNLQQRCWPQVSISYRVVREANLGSNQE